MLAKDVMRRGGRRLNTAERGVLGHIMRAVSRRVLGYGIAGRYGDDDGYEIWLSSFIIYDYREIKNSGHEG